MKKSELPVSRCTKGDAIKLLQAGHRDPEKGLVITVAPYGDGLRPNSQGLTLMLDAYLGLLTPGLDWNELKKAGVCNNPYTTGEEKGTEYLPLKQEKLVKQEKLEEIAGMTFETAQSRKPAPERKKQIMGIEIG